MKIVSARYELKLGVATREAYGQALLELGRKNRDVVVLVESAAWPEGEPVPFERLHRRTVPLERR